MQKADGVEEAVVVMLVARVVLVDPLGVV